MTDKPQYAYIHGCYTESKNNFSDDAVFVKRYAVYPDGRRVPEFVMHENVQRDFWITKPAYRKHDGKLEYEYLNRVDKFKSNQRGVIRTAQRKLGMMIDHKMQLRTLCNSPYIYGLDKDITCVVGDNYKKAFPEVDPFDLTVGCMDTETNVVDNSGNLIIMSFFHGNKAVVAVDRTWLHHKEYTEQQCVDFIVENIPEVEEHDIEVEVKFCPNRAECVIHVINRAHEWKPDIIGFWNINFDMPVLEKALKDFGHKPADIFSDPSVPAQYRYYHYKEGQTVKIMDSGKSMPLSPSQQWHTLFAPASFYFIDPSSTYRCLRRQKSEPSYSLDFITTKEVGKGKLKPQGLDRLKNAPEGTLKWHKLMQEHYPLWYIAYALVDVIQPVLMDRKTHDLSKKLNVLSMGSHWKDFNSNPRRLCDQLHEFFLSKGAVVGTTGSKMETPLDAKIPVSRDWIVTLEAPIIEDFGLKLLDSSFEESELRKGMRRSKIFYHNADLDIVSTYPILGMLFNIARETAMFETCKIEGLDYHTYREFGVNLTAGVANSMVIAEEVFGLKGFDDVLEDFEQAHGLASSREARNQRITDRIEAKRKIGRARSMASKKAYETAQLAANLPSLEDAA